MVVRPALAPNPVPAASSPAWSVLARLALVGSGGVFLVVIVRFTDLGVWLASPKPRGFWYLSRSSAIVAFVLLWFSMALGLSITNKLARLWPGGPLAFDLHQHTGLLGLLFSLFHIAILAGNPNTGRTLVRLLVPFAGMPYRPLWVAIGQLGFYLLIAVWLSSVLRQRIGQRRWRYFHAVSFLSFLLVLLHGIFAGTDSGSGGIRALYWVSGASLLGLMGYRLVPLLARRAGRRRQFARPPARSGLWSEQGSPR